MELFDFNKNKLKIKLNEMLGARDWQCNILEELINMKETSLEANLERNEINSILDYVSII